MTTRSFNIPAFENWLALTAGVGSQSRVKWRLRMESDLSNQRVAISPYRIVYACDVRGTLYAPSVGRNLKWTFAGNDLGAKGTAATGSNGASFFGSGPVGLSCRIPALKHDRTQEWDSSCALSNRPAVFSPHH